MNFLFGLLAFGVTIVTANGNNNTLAEFAQADARFATDFFNELSKTSSGNFLTCPLSAEIILGLVLTGAGGETAVQLSSALYLPNNKRGVTEIFTQLTGLLQADHPYILSSANKIYVQIGDRINPNFQAVAVKSFSASVENIDFANSVAAATKINNFVSSQTRGKINGIISPSSLGAGTSSVLVNTLYFEGNWTQPFDSARTKNGSFYVSDDAVAVVEMMQQANRFDYFESANLRAKLLRMSYDNSNAFMTIVLPNEVLGISRLEARLGDLLVSPNFTRTRVQVALPKFEFDTDIPLNPILQALGVTDAFTNNADLRGILVNQSLKISEVKQKTYIQVNEKGTTAAAATSVVLMTTAVQLPPQKKFIADHPFIFYIHIDDIILFLGRYYGPSK